MNEGKEKVTDIVERAAALARDAHGKIQQLRKFTGEPYIVHPKRVAGIVSSVTSDSEMIAAAWLHDVVEDTPVSIDEIAAEFGSEVAAMVAGVTKIIDGTTIGREKAAEMNIAHVGRGDCRIKTIKLADVIDNISDIVEHDPKFAVIYLAEKKALLEVLHDGDPKLLIQAEQLLNDQLRKLEQLNC